MSSSILQPQRGRMPAYFLSIGGPNFMEDSEHPAYAQLVKVGQEITQQVRPKAIVVFSAHWQSGPDKVEINAAENTEQIYDFYGFPAHYYEYKFPSRGSPELAEQVIQKLAAVDIGADKVTRGLDHGVWAGFIIAFDPKKNPLNVPIVQVSLFGNEDWDLHYRMGEALATLRDEGVLIVGAGMAAHNLNDFRAMRMGRIAEQTMPYVESFDEALEEAAASQPDTRRQRMNVLMKRGDARKAHPTLDHILPMFVTAGAAGSDVGKKLWTMPDKSLCWAQYRFGPI